MISIGSDREGCRRHRPYFETECMACIQTEIHKTRIYKISDGKKITQEPDEQEEKD